MSTSRLVSSRDPPEHLFSGIPGELRSEPCREQHLSELRMPPLVYSERSQKDRIVVGA